jgi:hypothetical protein
MRLFALMLAANVAVFASPALASSVSYEITLTQTGGTEIGGSDFEASTNFTVPNWTPNSQVNLTDLSFTIEGNTYTSNATIQFGSTDTAINNFYGFSGSDNGDSLTVQVSSFNLYGTGIGSTQLGNVSIDVAATPLPSSASLFAGAFGALALLMMWQRNRRSKGLQTETALATL